MIKQIEGTKIGGIISELVRLECEENGHKPETVLRIFEEKVNKIVDDLVQSRDIIIKIDQLKDKDKLDIMMKYTLMLDIMLHDSKLLNTSLKSIVKDLDAAYDELHQLIEETKKNL